MAMALAFDVLPTVWLLSGTICHRRAVAGIMTQARTAPAAVSSAYLHVPGVTPPQQAEPDERGGGKEGGGGNYRWVPNRAPVTRGSRAVAMPSTRCGS